MSPENLKPTLVNNRINNNLNMKIFANLPEKDNNIYEMLTFYDNSFQDWYPSKAWYSTFSKISKKIRQCTTFINQVLTYIDGRNKWFELIFCSTFLFHIPSVLVIDLVISSVSDMPSLHDSFDTCWLRLLAVMRNTSILIK